MAPERDVDTRPSLFLGLTTDALALVASKWPEPVHAPTNVQDLLAQARRLFVGGAVCYDNFVQAESVALQATEAALRHLLEGSVRPKSTLGELTQSKVAEETLLPRHLLWFRQIAVPWRNTLAHPENPHAVTPGMAAEFLEDVHRLIDEMHPGRA